MKTDVHLGEKLFCTHSHKCTRSKTFSQFQGQLLWHIALFILSPTGVSPLLTRYFVYFSMLFSSPFCCRCLLQQQPVHLFSEAFSGQMQWVAAISLAEFRHLWIPLLQCLLRDLCYVDIFFSFCFLSIDSKTYCALTQLFIGVILQCKHLWHNLCISIAFNLSQNFLLRP